MARRRKRVSWPCRKDGHRLAEDLTRPPARRTVTLTRCGSACVGLVIVAVAAAFALATSGSGAMPVVQCESPGNWPHTAHAAWVATVIAASGFKRTGCTGSAFVIDTGGSGRSGHDLYVWTTRGGPPTYSRLRVTIAGALVQHDRLLLRAVWRAGQRNVWVEAGPTTPKLIPLVRLRSLVRASLSTR